MRRVRFLTLRSNCHFVIIDLFIIVDRYDFASGVGDPHQPGRRGRAPAVEAHERADPFDPLAVAVDHAAGLVAGSRDQACGSRWRPRSNWGRGRSSCIRRSGGSGAMGTGSGTSWTSWKRNPASRSPWRKCSRCVRRVGRGTHGCRRPAVDRSHGRRVPALHA